MINLKDKGTIIAIIILSAAFLLILFGLIGLKTGIGAALFFILPFYLILDNFDLEEGEKIIFSLFLGLGIFSTFVYYLGFLFNSIKIAITVTFILLILAGILIKKLFSPKKNPDGN